MGEGLVGVEQPVAPGEQVALEHPHQGVLAQHLHHPPKAGQLAAACPINAPVFRQQLLHPHLFAACVDRLQPVRGRFIRAKHPQRIRVEANGIPQQLPQGGRVFGLDQPRPWNRHPIGLDRRQLQRAPQQAAIGVGIGAHAPIARG